jgi:hypothetical protein
MKGGCQEQTSPKQPATQFFFSAASLPRLPGRYSFAHTGCVKGGAHWFCCRLNPAAEAVDTE